MTKKQSFSFQRGWNQLKVVDAPCARDKIMTALGLVTRAGFLYRLKGKCEPTVTEAQAIEDIFNEYGIKDIWGED